MGQTKNYDQFKEHHENPALQEKGSQVLREFTRVVGTFNRSLIYKAKQRVSLQEKISALAHLFDENSKKLQTVIRNIEIYRQNNQKIAITLENLRQKETSVKDQFELLLSGSQYHEGSSMSGAYAKDREDRGVATLLTRESLTKRRKEYLDGLDNVFKQLEGELSSIEGIRKEMEQARVEISVKNEEALEAKESLENYGRELMNEIKAYNAELEFSVKEEQKLIKSYAQLVADVERRIEINQDIDHTLFSVLAAGEAIDKNSSPTNGSGSVTKSGGVFSFNK